MGATVLGLMSGTSADGVDAVLARFDGAPRQPTWRVINAIHHPYPLPLRQQLLDAGQGVSLSAAQWLELRQAVSEAQAACAAAADPNKQASLVGCHGQTLWHQPPQAGQCGASWQLLDACLLAERLQRTVVSDFRSADLARGGQGAPLVPLTDAALYPAQGGWRALLNLGGIANLTLLPPGQGRDQQPVQGWDCGPANTLLDLAAEHFSGGNSHFDEGGRWALQGQVHEAVVQRWLQEPFFQQPPPKSTGRELFGRPDLQRRLQELGESINPADALATLAAFSAAAVAADLQRGPAVVEMLVAGGGCRNQALMQQLRSRCRGLWVRSFESLGLNPQHREALAFALLAWWRQLGIAGSAPAITGARAGLLGQVAEP